MKLTITGSGSVKGSPVYGCHCRACAHALKTGSQRKPATAVLMYDGFILPIDAGIDLTRHYQSGSFQHILLTHYHMDHVYGLFNLRWGEGQSIAVHGPQDDLGCDDLFKHPGILDFSHWAVPFETFVIGPFNITPVPLTHSKLTVGFVIESQGKVLAYLSDTKGIPDTSREFIVSRSLDLLVMDCSYPPANEGGRTLNHNDIDEALAIHALLRPRKTVLTHIGHELDSWLWDHPDYLPEGVRIAEDGQEWSLI